MRCIYIDDVPVLFDPHGEAVHLVAPRVSAALNDAVPGRWRQGEWDGEYPLTGDRLTTSMARADELDVVFRAHGLRP